MHRRGVAGVALALACGACAPSLSTMRSAHVPPKGHLAAEMGMEVSVPTGAIDTILGAGKTLARDAESRQLTDDEKWKLFDAGTSLVLNLPGVGTFLGVAYVPLDRLEVGLRKTPGAWRLGVRYQMLDQATHPVDLTLGLGGTRYVYDFPVDNILDVLEVDPFTRYQVDVPLLVGRHGNFYRWWLGPKALFTSYETSVTLTLPVPGAEPTRELAAVRGSARYLGAQIGAALGWKHVFIGAELTIMGLWSSNDLTALGGARHVDFEGTIIYPSVGLMGEL